MSSLGYDEALLKKLQNWIKDDKIKITGPSETRRLFTYLGDITGDKAIDLPLITLRRLSPLRVLNTAKKPLTFDGYRKDNTGEKGDQLNAIPIQLDYQIDIYTRYFDESDEYIRNFIFNIINYPKLYIEIPYNDANIKHISNIRLSPDIEDNSDIPERLVEGQFTRRTISINIDDAYLFDYKVKDNVKIEDIDLQVELESDIEMIKKESKGD